MKTKELKLGEKDFALSRHLFSVFRQNNYTPEKGVNRLGYTEASFNAARYAAYYSRLCCRTDIYEDLAGTHYIVLEPNDELAKSRPALLMGSHVDAVPAGGQYDGMTGVVAALQAMEIIERQHMTIRQPVAAVLFQNEESSRFVYGVSSKMAVGLFPPQGIWIKDKLGSDALGLALEKCGLNAVALREKLEAHEELIPRKEMAAFAEAHIEQEDTLADEGYDIGIVNAVFGSVRCGYVRFVGEAAHSGTRPQDKRKDAILAGAHYIVELDKRLRSLAQNGRLVWSFGDTRVADGGSQNIVSPNNELLFDIRSDDERLLESALCLVGCTGRDVAYERGLRFVLDPEKAVVQKPVAMDQNMCDGFARAADKMGLRYKIMPSGAGHDSAIIQESGRKAGLLFIPHRGGSHHPAERLTPNESDDLFDPKGGYANAVRLLVAYATGAVLAHEDALSPKRSEKSAFAQSLLDRGARKIEEIPTP